MKESSQKKSTSYKRTRSIILSVVAVLEIVLLFMSITFSWFEGLTSLEITGENIKTGGSVNNYVTLGETKRDSNGDIIDGENFNDIIDLTSYFQTQQSVRLSPVSSADGLNFYAPCDGVPTMANYKTLHYRKLGPEDMNAQVISFEFKISSPEGPCDIYLTEILPVVTIDGIDYYSYNYSQNGTTINARNANPFRFAFSDGTTSHVLRVEDYLVAGAANDSTIQEAIASINDDGTINTITGSLTNKTTGSVERAQEYAYYTDHRTTTTGLGSTTAGTADGATVKPLFHLEKGESKDFTVSVWIEALDYECLNSTTFKPTPGEQISFSVKLCTTFSIPIEITAYDYSPSQPINADNNMALYVRNADSDSENKPLYELTYSEDDHSWTGYIPQALENCEFVWISKSDSTKTPQATFLATERNKSTEVSLFGSYACIWDIGADPSDVTEIFFKDFTSSGWVANPDELGNDIDMSVSITYNNKIIDYGMTDSPIEDVSGKDTWSCFIPSSLDFVKFNRSGYDENGNYVVFNYWNGSDRGDETVYRALDSDSGTTGTDSTYILYVSINSSYADKFYYNTFEPAISYTADSNLEYIESLNTAYATIDRTEYKPNLDTWPTGSSSLTKVPDTSNLYYIALDKRPTSNVTFTIWNRSAYGFDDVDQNMSFGIVDFAYTAGNTIYARSLVEITEEKANNNYYIRCEVNSTGSGVGSSSSASLKTGMWGDLVIASGTYTTYFAHFMDVDQVYVTYISNGYENTVALTKGEDYTWYTDRIPDDLDVLTFSDSEGNVWQDVNDLNLSTPRSETANYFYISSLDGTSSSGFYSSKITLATGKAVYFKHYNPSATRLTATFRYKNAYFTIDLEKDSDELTWSTTNIPNTAYNTTEKTKITFSDGTNTWENPDTNRLNKISCAYAISNNSIVWKTATSTTAADWSRIFFTDNYSWSTPYLYSWYTSNSTDTPETDWPGNAMTGVATNSDGHTVYYYLLSPTYNKIIFNNNNNGNQTVDITSGVSDMSAYYISGGSGTSHTVGTWDITGDFLDNYSN